MQIFILRFLFWPWHEIWPGQVFLKLAQKPCQWLSSETWPEPPYSLIHKHKVKDKNTLEVCVSVKTNNFHNLKLFLQSTFSASVILAVCVTGSLGRLRLVCVGAQYICWLCKQVWDFSTSSVLVLSLWTCTHWCLPGNFSSLSFPFVLIPPFLHPNLA